MTKLKIIIRTKILVMCSKFLKLNCLDIYIRREYGFFLVQIHEYVFLHLLIYSKFLHHTRIWFFLVQVYNFSHLLMINHQVLYEKRLV